jgi:hypothetical protein
MIKKNEISRKKIEMMRESDWVTCTTKKFANTIKTKLGIKNVMVFPNAVNEDEPQYKINKIESDKIRFGWLGGSSHLFDIELMSNGISTTHNSYKDKVQFVLCGFDLRGTVTEIDSQTNQQRNRPIKPTETVWYKYEKIFTDNYSVINDEYKTYLNSFGFAVQNTSLLLMILFDETSSTLT